MFFAWMYFVPFKPMLPYDFALALLPRERVIFRRYLAITELNKVNFIAN